MIRLTLDLVGTLQGVGFRPTVARLALTLGLGGSVRNQLSGVRLVLVGESREVDRFISDLPSSLPSQARLESVKSVSREHLPLDYEGGEFEILESQSGGKMRVSIPADLAVCEQCAREVFDRESRYYGHPFTTCTDCGPRYSVVSSMPYDRGRTSMRDFPLCDDCASEYADPSSRRFHAESISCRVCGPSVSLYDASTIKQEGAPIPGARRALAAGEIVAIRGLGGYLLAADASNAAAILRLRERKHRPDKPFAVMAKDLSVVSRYCQIDSHQAAALSAPEGPIVVLPLRDKYIEDNTFQLLAPQSGTLGVMLPTTPLHLLLASALEGDPTGDFDLLLMTSGNRGGEPICLSNEEAFERLATIADWFLCHNREVIFRCDDSLVRWTAGRMRVLRRARGFAPGSVRLHRPLNDKYIAFGADLKNTLALGFDSEVVVSPHIGDLDTVPALTGLEQVMRAFPDYFQQTPNGVLVDLHPDMRSARLGREFAKERGLPVYEVQHHHAHAAAAMAEHDLERALALVFDGTGYGGDGTIWGAELLHVVPGKFERLATFRSSSLPGGDAAIVHPVRQLLARWFDAGDEIDERWLERLRVSPTEFEHWKLQCERGINTYQTHGAGRVFDAYSMMLGVSPSKITYEGQAAIGLEAIARRCVDRALEVPYRRSAVNELFEIDFSPAFSMYSESLPTEAQVPALALGFHQAIVQAGTEMASYGRDLRGENRIVLSGGVMMNGLIVEGLFQNLTSSGFEVHLPSTIPVNDGGVSLGQIVAFGGNL